MGLTLPCCEFLIDLRARGLDFKKVLQLGRQHLYASPTQVARMMKRSGLVASDRNTQSLVASMVSDRPYSDGFFRLLGSDVVAALDYSEFEGAEVVHDLNTPIPPDLFEQFDTVIDGGLLEHVFNFPMAIKNCMELVKVGGNLILFTVTNNFCGHGFYQFSPELFYSILCKENGFAIEAMIGLEHNSFVANILSLPVPALYLGRRWSVPDPREVRRRIELVNNQPTLLMIQARRTARAEIFAVMPQQSDYLAIWEPTTHSQAPDVTRRLHPVRRFLEARLSPSKVADLAWRWGSRFAGVVCRYQNKKTF